MRAQISVMCTTIEKRRIHGDMEECKYGSCAEWCLSKGGSSCHHLYVSVRQNGTDVRWEECRHLTNTSCPRFEKVPEEARDCAKDDECSELDEMFLCQQGTCWNITAAFSCQWEEEDAEASLDCHYKRNCIELDGMYTCSQGHCSK